MDRAAKQAPGTVSPPTSAAPEQAKINVGAAAHAQEQSVPMR
jgi:hypothetical protein